ncbi:hypothetical protein I7X12_05705 [Halosimplex litoreum]|uniref:Uncharacterized protein n=1 Tax=Halosimplex litoreum TaxID=1198301 RepID=A0A7T3KWG4_9EURY|nr:hypothetical protein [Halosimplex litoreum]QPV64119.1 hypothetical protein I7X12_05705 [Halosimplex litoreum]
MSGRDEGESGLDRDEAWEIGVQPTGFGISAAPEHSAGRPPSPDDRSGRSGATDPSDGRLIVTLLAALAVTGLGALGTLLLATNNGSARLFLVAVGLGVGYVGCRLTLPVLLYRDGSTVWSGDSDRAQLVWIYVVASAVTPPGLAEVTGVAYLVHRRFRVESGSVR